MAQQVKVLPWDPHGRRKGPAPTNRLLSLLKEMIEVQWKKRVPGSHICLFELKGKQTLTVVLCGQ